jgi:hypothetical protein
MVSHIYFSSKFICKLMFQIFLQVGFNSLQHITEQNKAFRLEWNYILPRGLVILPWFSSNALLKQKGSECVMG